MFFMDTVVGGLSTPQGTGFSSNSLPSARTSLKKGEADRAMAQHSFGRSTRDGEHITRGGMVGAPGS